MNGYNPYNATTTSYQSTQYFPQPQGNVYMINNSLEVANIPMGSGFSVALCPSEELMYIKTFQGGAPTLMVYSIKPYDQNLKPTAASFSKDTQEKSNLEEQVEKLSKAVEEIKSKIGGKIIDELL